MKMPRLDPFMWVLLAAGALYLVQRYQAANAAPVDNTIKY